MRTLEEVKGRCNLFAEPGHWIWTGSANNGGTMPTIYAPDLSRGGALKTQTGPRVVWQMNTGKKIPKGHRVFRSCGLPLCLNPECLVSDHLKVHGRRLAKSGAAKGLVSRIVANRKTNRSRSSLTLALIEEIKTSPETGEALRARLGICRNTISRVRTGKLYSFQPVGGVFSGLMAR